MLAGMPSLNNPVTVSEGVKEGGYRGHWQVSTSKTPFFKERSWSGCSFKDERTTTTHVLYRCREKGKKKPHFISNCLHLPIARTTMQTPAAGKQPSISNQRVSHKKKKKCRGRILTQKQKHRCASFPTALNDYDLPVCSFSHRRRGVCVYMFRELSELSRRTFSSCSFCATLKRAKPRQASMQDSYF